MLCLSSDPPFAIVICTTFRLIGFLCAAREFAFIGAFTHTVVFVFGLMCASLLQRATVLLLRRGGPRARPVSDGRPEPITVLTLLALMLWLTAVFHSLAWRFLHFCFEHRLAPLFQFADMFFNEGVGTGPFAWSSSVSYSSALFIGLLLNADDFYYVLTCGGCGGARAAAPVQQHAGKPGTSPLLLKSWALVYQWVGTVGVPFIFWLLTLDKVMLPFFAAASRSPLQAQAGAAPGLASDAGSVNGSGDSGDAGVIAGDSGKSIAYVLGMLLCSVLPTALGTGHRVLSLLSMRGERGVPSASLARELPEALADAALRLAGTFLLSSLFLTVSLYDHNQGGIGAPVNLLFALESVFDIVAQLRFLILVSGLLLGGAMGVLALVVLGDDTAAAVVASGPSSSSSPSRPGQRSARPPAPVLSGLPTWAKDAMTLTVVAALWNCHLIGWWGSFGPFQVYAAVLRQRYGEGAYSIAEAALDGWNFVFFASYIPPIVLQAMIKIFSAKFKLRWGLWQECVNAFFFTVPLSLLLAWYWTHDKPGLPLMVSMTVTHLLYVGTTWRNRPEHTGWRFWPELRSHRLWDLIEYYFDQNIIVDLGDRLPVINTALPGGARRVPWTPNRSNHEEEGSAAAAAIAAGAAAPRPRIIGFHPHGILPCSLLWYSLTPKWRAVFGSLMPVTLTDAFIHHIPFMREFAQWSGGLEVSKSNVERCLAEGRTIQLIPGGQGEILLHTQENLEAKRMVVCNRHQGFIRVALQFGADLVPSFSFGELQAMGNINFASLQRVTRKLVGFPFPFFPVGRLGLLPVPRPVKMTYVLGEPIPAHCATPGMPTDQEVEALHRRYFEALIALCAKHKEAAGYGDWTVELSHPYK